MTDRPILFSAPMVRALLDGRKTQTRRVIKPKPFNRDGDTVNISIASAGRYTQGADGRHYYAFDHPKGGPLTAYLARFNIGDRLWVREAWARTSVAPIISTIDNPLVVYRSSDNRTDYGGPWKPGIHMPRWASRLTLTVTDVRVQRLHDCTDEDAMAEGIVYDTNWGGYVIPGVEHPNKDFPVLMRATPVAAYAALWDVINGSGSWLGNPWVVAVSFTVEKWNIDADQWAAA